MSFIWILLIVFSGSLTPAVCESPESDRSEISADRPGFTEPPDVLRVGVVQYESGFLLERDREEGVSSRTWQLGVPLVRFGLAKRVELRFTGDGYRFERHRSPVATEEEQGLSDWSLGCKWNAWDEGKVVPAFAVVPMLSLPIGSRRYSSSGYDPMLKLSWGKSLPRSINVSGNFNFASLTYGAERVFQRATSVSLGHDLPAGLRGYEEIYAISRFEGASGNSWVFDTGVSHAVGKNAQVDAEIGHSLTRSGPDWFVAFGFAVRSPAWLSLRH